MTVDLKSQSSGETKELLQLLDSDCREPCWKGIEIGRTHKGEAIRILTELDLITGIPESNSFSITATLKDNLLWRDINSPYLTVWLENDLVLGLILPVNVCALDVFAAHGIPILNVPTNLDTETYYLYYPRVGLSYAFRSDDGYTAHLTVLSKEVALDNAGPDAVRWDHHFDLSCD